MSNACGIKPSMWNKKVIEKSDPKSFLCQSGVKFVRNALLELQLVLQRKRLGSFRKT